MTDGIGSPDDEDWIWTGTDLVRKSTQESPQEPSPDEDTRDS